MKDFSRNIMLLCSICGNDQFEKIEKKNNYKDFFKCSHCGNVFTQEQLIEENQNIIDCNIEDIKNEVIKCINKKFKKGLKKWK